MEERVPSLKDLIFRILIKWRMIIVFMIIGAVVLSGVSYVQSIRNIQTEEYVQTENNTKDIAVLEQGLTKREKTEVHSAVNAYNLQQQYYTNLLEYSNKSVTMKIDPNKVPTYKIQYLVDTHYEAVYPVIKSNDMTQDIITACADKICGANMCTMIAEKLSLEIDYRYVQELIDTGRNGNVLSVSVIGDCKETCMEMMDVIINEVESITQELQDIFGDFDMTEINRQYFEKVNTSLLSAQQSQASSLNNVKYTISNITSGMTEKQREYYYALLDQEITDEDEEIVLDNVSVENINENAISNMQQSPEISKKYMLLGLISGAVFACLMIVISYMLKSSLCIKDDLPNVYKIPLIGTFKMTEDRKRVFSFVDRFIESVFEKGETINSNEEYIGMVCTNIKLTAKKKGMRKIFITGTCDSDESENLKLMVCNKIKSEFEEISYGKSILNDPESLEKMASSDGIVIIEQIDKSLYVNIQKEVEVCEMNQVPIIGSIVLK